MESGTTIDRVQNVETRQSLLERALRIGTVDFDTAGTDQSQFCFEGVATPKRVVVAVDRAHELAAAERAAADRGEGRTMDDVFDAPEKSIRVKAGA